MCHRAWALAALAPIKDMEVTVIGNSLECPDFQLMLFVALRTLIDRLGAAAFNVGIFNVGISGSNACARAAEVLEATPILARYALKRRVPIVLNLPKEGAATLIGLSPLAWSTNLCLTTEHGHNTVR